MKTVRTFQSVVEADAARSFLEAAGIGCVVRQAEAAVMIGMGAGSLALEVNDEDLDEAKALLSESAAQADTCDTVVSTDSDERFHGRIPFGLHCVAASFLLLGCYGVYQLLTRSTREVYIPLNVLGLFIGVGLLRRRTAWRTCALIFTWLSIALCIGIMTVLVFKGSPPTEVMIFLCTLVVIEACTVLVLSRREVKAVFGLQ